MTIKSSGTEIVVVGAGVIGLSLALELRIRGHNVTVVDTRKAMRQASWAAAGMLAVEDPHNPPALLPLSRLSASLYPEYLRRIETLSGEKVQFQTEWVVEYLDGDRVMRRPERSLDPRHLGMALLGAIRQSGVAVYEDVGGLELLIDDDAVGVRTASGPMIEAEQLVHSTGAWFQRGGVVTPCKGQMMRVRMSTESSITEVHRRGDVYIVPRTRGLQAGTALIGATVEDVGFDLSTRRADLDRLRLLAGELLPAFGDEAQTPMVEAWAGLRSQTQDGLPLSGPLQNASHQFAATGHFRNGILLAPGTADALADNIEGRQSSVELKPFAPNRFA